MSRIVFEQDGELHVLDIASGKDTRLSILVPNDGVAMRPSRLAVEKNIEDFALAPGGERALFVARGDVFTAPIDHGPTRNLTRSSNAHDKWARWSPDGRQVAYISDRSGEDQLWLVSQDGLGAPQQLTTGLVGMLYAPAWSPDGKHIAFSDKEGRIHVVTIADRRLRTVADEERGQVNDYAWSPGGSYLAFSLSHPSGFRSIRVWGAGDAKRAVPFNLSDDPDIVKARISDKEMNLPRILFKPKMLVSTHILRSFENGSILKNLFGCILDTKRAKYHKILPKLLADVYETIGGIDLAILDGTRFWHGEGTTPVQTNTLLLRRDAVAVEAVGSAFAGLNP